MKKIINMLLAIFLCLSCLTINVSAENELSKDSDGQNIVNDADVPKASSSSNDTIVVSSSTEETNYNSEIDDKQEDITKYSLSVEYYFDGEYTTTLESARYKPGEYGFIASTTDGYVTKEVDGETKYYFIDSIRINSEPVAEEKIKINEDNDGKQEYLYLMGAEDATIIISFSSKSTTESTVYTSQEVFYQDNDGNIILTLDDSYEISTISYITFRSNRDDYNRYYIYWCHNFYKENKTITISYEEEIKHSNLKGGLNYFVSVHYDSDIQKDISGEFYISKGSDRKDLPLYNAIQEENGDILVAFNEVGFPTKVTEIRLKNSETQIGQQFAEEDFYINEDNKSITIPYDSVKKSQLIIGEYRVSIVYDTMFSDSPEYFEFESETKMNITAGSCLPSLPEYRIYQEDNGDIVIESDSETLIGLIGGIRCREANGKDSDIFFEQLLKREGNEIIVPFEYIFCSSLLSNNNYSFEIMLYKNDIFKYDFNDVICDVLINKGTIKEFLTVNQDQNGDIVFRLNDNEVYNSIIEMPLESIRLDSFYGSNYWAEIDRQYFQISENSITIPYNVVESSNLKEGLTYGATFNGFYSFISLDFVLNKGSKKKDPLDYSALQNEIGDIVLSFEDAEFSSNVTQVRFEGYQNDCFAYFNNEKLTYEGNIITIPYSMIRKSQLTEGDYYIDIYYDTNQYFDNIPVKRISITLGSTLPTLPDFDIHQEDNGDIVISSENSEFIQTIGYVHYSVEGHGYTFINEVLEREENRITVPYEYVLLSNLKTGIISKISIGLISEDIFLGDTNPISKEVEIKKGSVIEYLSARQDEEGNIIIEMSDNNIFESLEDLSLNCVSFSCSDETNGRYYGQRFYDNKYATSDNAITIPYSQIEYSDLKQGLEYQITLSNESTSGYLSTRLLLNKGSKKKDAPDFSVVQNENGDIVLHSDDSDFLDIVTYLSIYGKNSVSFGKENFVYGSIDRTITIPYKVIEKSQLIEDKYKVSVLYEGIYTYDSPYFDNIPDKPITITQGSRLPTLPDFNINQEDNGDIVLHSDSEELIKQIDSIAYWKSNNQRAGGPAFFEDSFIIDKNTITIPYSIVLLSQLESNTNYCFSIGLRSNDIFLYDYEDLKREVYIEKGSITEYLSAKQDEDGNVIVEMANNNIFESLKNLPFKFVYLSCSDETNGRNYNQTFDGTMFDLSDDTIAIPYSQIEYSNLKQGLEYLIKLDVSNLYIPLPSRLLLNKGSKKKDAPDFSVVQNENGDIVLHSDDSDFLDIVTYLSIYGKNSVSFGKENFVYGSIDRTITIPYKVIEKSQLIEDKYKVSVLYEGIYTYDSPYFDNIPDKPITITQGSRLPTLPDFNINQEDNGDIVLYSESEELIKQIDHISYWKSNNQRAGGPAFFEDSFIIDKNTITIPYSIVLLSQLESNKNHHFNIVLRSQDIYLYDYETTNREVYINKGSIIEYLSARQEDNGNIIIEMADNSLFGNIKDLSTDSIYLYGYDEINDRDYDDIIFARNLEISDNTITIPYNRIEHSDLKQGLEYRIRLTTKIADIYLSSRLLLNKGSSKKDTPDYRVNQNINGDIVFSFGDAGFASSITKIQIYNFEINKYIYISNYDFTCTSGTITIPYSVIKESQLSKGEYNVNLFYDNTKYFDDTLYKSLVITKGSILPVLPDYEIRQKDNGDIVLYSDSKELISQISRIYYWTSINQRAGAPSFDEKSFIVGKNTLAIPYQVVKYSELEGNNVYTFRIELRSDDVFLTGESCYKEVKIDLGSLTVDKPYLNINKDISGVVSIIFDSQDDFNKLDKGEYQLNYLLYCGNEKETQIDRNSLVFDYDNKMVYAIMDLIGGETYSINLVKGEEIISSATYYAENTPIVDQRALFQNINEEKLLDYLNAYYDSLYPNANFNIYSIGIHTDVVQDADIDKYFKIYSLSDSNSLILDISLYPIALYGNVEILKIPYDRPGENIKLELSASLEQMSKLGITKDNYTQNEIVVLREHDGKVDELVATLEPVVVGDTIISFKVKFETDKMSLFAIANKGSVIKPSTGSSGGSSTRKPVVNTSSK